MSNILNYFHKKLKELEKETGCKMIINTYKTPDGKHCETMVHVQHEKLANIKPIATINLENDEWRSEIDKYEEEL